MALNSLNIKTFRAPGRKILVKNLLDLYLKGKLKLTPSEDLIIGKDLK